MRDPLWLLLQLRGLSTGLNIQPVKNLTALFDSLIFARLEMSDRKSITDMRLINSKRIKSRQPADAFCRRLQRACKCESLGKLTT